VKRLFSFPNPVNDAAARTVALGVVAMSTTALIIGWAWLLVPLTYGFVARVATGPTLSPLGQFAVRVAAPRLTAWTKALPGPPKRFAQAIGATLTLSATGVWLGVGWSTARWFMVPLLGAAALEGFFGICVGCIIFGRLMRAGMIPASVCADCGDLSQRYAAAGYPTPADRLDPRVEESS
jgi:hypothetical protein